MGKNTAILVGMPNRKYRLLREELQKVIKEIPFSIEIKEVNEVDQILNYSVASIPAILVNDRVIFENGRIPKHEELLETIFLQLSKHLIMKNILIPIDFSENSLHAYLFAQQLAEQTKSNLQLIHLNTIQIDPYTSGASDIDAILDQNQKRLEDFLDKNRFLQGEFKISAKAKIGFAAEGILNFSSAENVDMILLGTRGASNLGRKLFGSVSIKVAKEAKCPVLLIPPNAKFKGIEEILFLSEQAEANAITKLAMKQLCEQFDAFAHVIHVERQKNEDFQLKRLNIEIMDNHRSFRSIEIASSSIVEGVNEYIEHHPIDLGVIITHHRNFMDKLFHKSMTKQIAMHIEIPLMVLHLDV